MYFSDIKHITPVVLIAIISLAASARKGEGELHSCNFKTPARLPSVRSHNGLFQLLRSQLSSPHMP